jgi:hypothetical protein
MAILIALYTIIIFFFIIFDLIPLFHQKKWKVFWVYTILISFSYVIHVLFTMGVKLPSPAVPIKKVVSFIFGLQD